jgi:hypothetical protein
MLVFCGPMGTNLDNGLTCIYNFKGCKRRGEGLAIQVGKSIQCFRYTTDHRAPCKPSEQDDCVNDLIAY